MQTFNLDLSVKRVIPLLYAKQRDVGAKICIKLTDNEENYVVPDDVTWSVWYSGAGVEGNYDKIDGRDAVVVNGSTATVELIYQMLDNPGPGEMCIVMNSADGTQLGLWNIPYFVEAIPGANSKAAIAYYQAFLQAQEKSEAAAVRAEVAAEDAMAAAKEAANKKPQDLKVTATFDTVVNDTISTGTAGTSAYDVATAISKGATVTLIDDDNRVYKYCGYRLEPNYSNAFFEAQEIDANGITTYRATINNEGQASRTKYTHEYATAATDPNRHAEYFTITEDGVLSLKPEYRGEPAKTTYPDAISDMGVGVAGSQNAELPEHLVIPEVVEIPGIIGEVAAARIADGAFYGNTVIKTVTLPKTIKEIPTACFMGANKLEKLYNTEHITTVGSKAFQNAGITSVNFPNLTTMDTAAFCQCWRLTHANIGEVAEIPTDAFYKCRFLSRIDSENCVTSVGATALWGTNRLVNADFVKNLKTIGKGAFACSGVDYDWSTLANCTFGNNATALQINPTDFWSACTPNSCENPLPTLLCQSDPRWTNRAIGNSGITWGAGCQLFCIMHAYCGLNNLSLESVEEFEDIVNATSPGLLDTYSKNIKDAREFASSLGITVTDYYEFNQENLQALYAARCRQNHGHDQHHAGSARCTGVLQQPQGRVRRQWRGGGGTWPQVWRGQDQAGKSPLDKLGLLPLHHLRRAGAGRLCRGRCHRSAGSEEGRQERGRADNAVAAYP